MTDNKPLIFVPDTNLFIQCRALEQIDWSQWRDCPEVRIVFTRPVIREIDKHKSQGKGRVQDRARKAASLIRSVRNSESGYLVVREGSPRVILESQVTVRPTAELETELDYSERDDQLVGTAHALSKAYSDSCVILLTGDQMAIESARAIGLSFVETPTDWLLPPEPSSDQKKLAKLATEVEKLKSDQPEFEVCYRVNGDEPDGGRYEIELDEYSPLSKPEIEEILRERCAAHPMKTNFEVQYRKSNPLLGQWDQKKSPPNERSISAYKKAYHEWRSQLAQALEQIHQTIQELYGFVQIEIEVNNVGPVFADNVHLSVSIAPDQIILNSDEHLSEHLDGTGAGNPFEPPTPPEGKWRSVYEDLIPNLTGSLPQPPKIDDLLGPMDRYHALSEFESSDPSQLVLTRKSSNELVYECDYWRHKTDPQKVNITLRSDIGGNDRDGCIECVINAKNLKDPVSFRLPIQVSVKRVSTMDVVQDLIRQSEKARGEP